MHSKISKNIALTFIIIFMMAACSKDPITGKTTYNWYGIEKDPQFGEEVIAGQLSELRKKNAKVDEAADPVMTRKIREMTRRIAAVSHYPNFPFEAHYADVDIVNAWCAPGGKVMVYSGLFDPQKGLVKKSSDDELAAVLGHEIAHATARHVTKAMSRNMTLMAVGQVAVSAIGASGAGLVQDAFNQAIVSGINLYIPAYSRSNEAEADRIGIMYAAKAGYNPQAAVDLWYRACQKKGNNADLYASHPSNCDRAKSLEALLPEAMSAYHKTQN
ncbi:MAG: M48 family metallopeptidase [Deltaproteobacteria bacterium]|nr:MAG: M48 family metallopeptidase [Deltaproteobacteria bacterium]